MLEYGDDMNDKNDKNDKNNKNDKEFVWGEGGARFPTHPKVKHCLRLR